MLISRSIGKPFGKRGAAMGVFLSACLARQDKVKVFAEDVGRHNALDKAVGEALMLGLRPGEFILLTSGRISAEIVLKAARAGIAFIVSRGAPPDQAADLAEKRNMTLVGFARNDRMNIYSGKGRVL